MVKVFISSTAEDLRQFRQVARDVVLDLGWQPIMMEHFGADADRPTLEACVERVEQADIALAILAWRRGWVPDVSRGGDGKKSITAWEIESALSHKKPVLALMARDTWPGRLWESNDEARAWVESFRKELDRLAAFFEWEEFNSGVAEPLPIFRSKVRQELLRYHQAILADSSREPKINRTSVPVPVYRDERIRQLSDALDKAYQRYDELKIEGQDPSAIQGEILHLRRELREGGQLKAGDRLAEGRFKLLEPIGRGGFASVWKGYDRKRHELVAVKVLHGQFAEDRTQRERFFRGARKMADLQHHGIVQVIESELEDGGFYFFVMEYLSGGDLGKAVLSRRISAAQDVLGIISDLGQALSFAHQKGIIHRDIKPGNVLLDDKGRPKLSDFDLVHAFDTTGGTRTGMLGTFLYAAPEALTKPQSLDVRADVYSLAMTVMFCLRGSDLPLDALRTPDFIETLPCNLATRAILQQATSWDVRERFSSVDDFMSVLLESYFFPSPLKGFRSQRVRRILLKVIDPFQRLSRAVLDSVNRNYFRERYDAHQILSLLVERIGSIRDTATLARLITRDIDLALHLERIAMLVLDPHSGMFKCLNLGSQRLDASSALALLMADSSEPLSIDLEVSSSPVAKLPERDRHWLVDSGFKLVVPILSRDGSLVGLLGLGEKRSGVPFQRRDRQLLCSVANSAALVLELAQAESLGTLPLGNTSSDAETVGSSKECSNCGRLFPFYTVLCNACSRRLEPSHVPYVLPGKFRFEKRIGTGDMGVVYRASDLALGRPVAVKTLRRMSPEDAMRLRREARTAAAVSHPHLAPVYGMETWQGTPMLILELLEGGTLAHRLLDRGRLTPQETVDLGIAMTEALAQLHVADILHRDIKPSNIGFNRDGIPKLMDFGIARLMYDLRREREEEGGEGVTGAPSDWTPIDGVTPHSKPVIGTLSYLCPEALEGKPPDALFDLWSLVIVLYECLLGRKVFSSADPRQTAARIRLGRVPDLLQLAPEYDENLADFFRTALHRSRRRRPASARELKQRLEAVRKNLA